MGGYGFSIQSFSTWRIRGGNMNIKMVEEFLLWCGAINYGMLLIWFLFFTFAHDWIHRITGRCGNSTMLFLLSIQKLFTAGLNLMHGGN
ncbi:MAG: DUF6868 family protein [Candidatus Deferrimicrobiaceae bacterium]